MRPPAYRRLDTLLPWPAAAKPLDAERVFGRAVPLELEIGPGNGEYLAGLAAARPEHDFLAVERFWGRVKKGLRKVNGAGLPNARLVCGQAEPVLGYLLPPRSLTRVHTLFPCPWPGDEDGRHRLYAPPFLRLVNSRLIEGGEVLVVTDDRDYFDWVLAQVPGTGFAMRSREVGADFGTKFERKWHAGGQERFYRLDLTKADHQPLPLSVEKPMRSHRLDSFDPESFALPDRVYPAEGSEPTRVRARELLFDPVRGQGLVRVVVVEPGLSQELWIEIAGQRGGGYMVAPARACHALLTDGVQLALDAVAEAAGLQLSRA